jgi:hypothetical protein
MVSAGFASPSGANILRALVDTMLVTFMKILRKTINNLNLKSNKLKILKMRY